MLHRFGGSHDGSGNRSGNNAGNTESLKRAAIDLRSKPAEVGKEGERTRPCQCQETLDVVIRVGGKFQLCNGARHLTFDRSKGVTGQ